MLGCFIGCTLGVGAAEACSVVGKKGKGVGGWVSSGQFKGPGSISAGR